jgi:ferritin-like metal-binding protein YciE
MTPYSFQNLFIEQLNELYSGEQQIAAALPEAISVASSNDLRIALDNYLLAVRHHIQFLEACFGELKVNPSIEKCKPIEGILEEMVDVEHHGGNSAVKDASLIGMIQRLLHYKMAIYGTARTFARHLNYHAMDFLQRALNEEGEMDKKLTYLAEGGIFSTGINEEAVRTKIFAEV